MNSQDGKIETFQSIESMDMITKVQNMIYSNCHLRETPGKQASDITLEKTSRNATGDVRDIRLQMVEAGWMDIAALQRKKDK